MPFNQNFLSFTLSLFIFTFLVALALNWNSWSQSVASWFKIELRLQRRILKREGQEPESEEDVNELGVVGSVTDAIASSWTPKWRFFVLRGRSERAQSDVEAGTGPHRSGS
jgi:hypothetical protein